jgi:hypothetical protein
VLQPDAGNAIELNFGIARPLAAISEKSSWNLSQRQVVDIPHVGRLEIGKGENTQLGFSANR